MIRRIQLEITYEASGKFLDMHHSFYMLDRFTEACKEVIEKQHTKNRDGVSIRLTRAVDDPTKIYE